MHRDIQISVPPEVTDSLVDQLKALDGVISVAVHRGHAVKPAGDVVAVAALNIDADEVLRLATEAEEHGAVTITTSEVDSVLDSEQHRIVRDDHDEATWEEVETAMRHHTRPNFNLALTTVGGGVIAAAALSSTSGATEATALVASQIIAPVFEPVALVGVGLINRHRLVAQRGLTATVMAYLGVIAGALVTMLVLRAGNHGYVYEFMRSSTAHEVQHPPLANYVLSAAGALTGAVMVAAGRFSVLAGPVVALQLVPAAAVVGIGIELGDGGIALRGLARLGVDLGMLIVACLIIFTYKHVTAHSRRRIPH